MARSSEPSGELLIDAPPQVPRAASTSLWVRLLPLVTMVAMVGVMAVYFSSGVSRGTASMVFPVMMVMSVLGTLAYSLRGNGHGAELERSRREYLCYLDGIDAVTRRAAAEQAETLHAAHPDPSRLWAFAGTDRVAVREASDPTFCEVRIGVGARPLGTRLVVADTTGDTDPVAGSALRRLLRTRSVVHDVPVTVALGDAAAVVVTGDQDSARALLRAVVCQAAVFHSPRDLRIVAVVGRLEAAYWEWLKWLPHHEHPTRCDAAGPARMTHHGVAEVARDIHASHVLVIVDGVAEPESLPGYTVLRVGLSDAGVPPGVILELIDDTVRCGDHAGRRDGLTIAQASTCARQLARHRRAVAPRTPGTDWRDLVGRSESADLDVPIGTSERGEPVYLDIKEAAHGGMGPHGLCVGATGSGKSELLRTLVLGLIATHPPDVLNVVLVDFKGGATFLGLEAAPHVSAVITNLSDEAAKVTRMADALSGEIIRRQELLRAAGNHASIADYRRSRPKPPALPTLLIVVDEFSELLYQHPDFAELFVAIGRLGRSLGVHLLLASQRLDEGRLRGLETHLSYRICLKTFSPSESRAVLGVPDAYELPGTPGAAYLRAPTGELTRFQTAFVSGPAPHAVAALRVSGVTPFRAVSALPDDATSHADAASVLDTMLAQISEHEVPAHQIWLPPLPPAVPLRDLLLTGAAPLTVAIGLVDSPVQQRRDRLIVALHGAQGNAAIVGGPQSGKSTAARTLALALAATHRPGEISIYCLDFGGGSLAGLRELPHVGSVVGRHEDDLVRRTVAELEALIRRREQQFRELGFESMEHYRRDCGAGACEGDGYGDVFLIVDGWAALRRHFESLENSISAIASQGLSYGVHVVLTAARWADFRPALKDQLGTRIELRLGDPAESEMDRKRARQLGSVQPGRGLMPDGRELLVALPRLDGSASATDLSESLRAVGATLGAQYPGVTVPPIRVLPARVSLGGVARAHPATEVAIGVGERELAPVHLDFAEHPDLVVLGEPGCGKSTVLRTVCHELVTGNDAAAVQLLIVDFRRSLLGAVESEHLAGYAMSSATLDTALAALIERLRTRIPGADVTQQQLRTRSWWSGPELYVIVDDYDLVAGSGVNPLAPLIDFLAHARDVGLHVVLARRSGGAARALFDPLLATMKNLGCMGLLMSASPDEGVLLGSVRSRPLPVGRGTLVQRSGEQLIQVFVQDELR